MKLHAITLHALLCSIFLGSPEYASCAQLSQTIAGSLDTSFFTGTAVIPSWNGGPTIHRILVQPDGRVLIGGGFEQVQHYARPGLARLESNGTLDPDFVPANQTIQDVVIEPDGRMVVASKERGLARLNIDCTLETSFDGQITNGATAVARLPQGEFLAGIYVDDDPLDSTPRFGVARFDAQGRRCETWSSAYRSSKPITCLLVAPGGNRVVVDGAVEISLATANNNHRWLTNALPAGFRVVSSAFQPDGKLLLGNHAPDWPLGTNSVLSPAVVRLNVDGSRDVNFADLSFGVGEVDGARDQIRISAIAVDRDGKILIGGFFTRVNGEARPLVARLFGDGRLDPSFVPDIDVSTWWDTDALQSVSAMAFTPEGQLLIAGVLTRCNGIDCRALVRLHTAPDAGGGILTFAEDTCYTWETNGPVQVALDRLGSSNGVVSVVYEVADISLSAPEPTPKRGIVKFESGETRKSIAVSVQDNLLAEGNRAYRLVLSNPAGGAVLTGKPEMRLVVLDDETAGRPGSVDLSFPPLEIQGRIYSLFTLALEPDGSALISVIATTGYATVLPMLLRVLPNGNIDPSFHPVTDEPVYYAHPNSVTGQILIYGGFSTVNGQIQRQLARLNHDGSLDRSFSVTCDRWISGAIVQSDGKILIHGNFNSINQVPRTQFARLNQDGTVDAAFDTSRLSWFSGTSCVAIQPDGKVIVGGLFDQVNGVALTNLARLNNDGSLDLSFDPGPAGINAYIRSILYQPDGKILVSGSLRCPDGNWGKAIRLNEDGSLDTSFNADAPGFAQGWPILLQPDGKIILDGKWRLNSDGSRDHSFLTAEDAANVTGITLLPNGDLLVSGIFSTFAQWPRPWLVRLRGGNAPIFGFFESANSYLNVSEDAGSTIVRVRRVGPADQEATVALRTADGTALKQLDYLPVAVTLRFAPGVVEQSVSIPVLHRAGYQQIRHFQVLLQDLAAGIRSPSGDPVLVSIIDSTPGLTFSQTNNWITADEINTNDRGTVVTYVQRHGDLTEALAVKCELRAGTAVAGQDFEPVNLTLRFEPGQSEIPVIAPLIRNDTAVEDRTVFLVLNGADPGWSLTTDSTATLTILGKPRRPGFVSGTNVFDPNGCLRVACDLRPREYLEVEVSTDLLNWTSFQWIYREPNRASPWMEDPDAWKYSRRFYRFLPSH